VLNVLLRTENTGCCGFETQYVQYAARALRLKVYEFCICNVGLYFGEFRVIFRVQR